MRKPLVFLLSLLFFFVSKQYGQPSSQLDTKKNTEKLFKLAKKAFEANDFFLAKGYIDALKEKKFTSNDQRYLYALLYFKLNLYQEALIEIDTIEKSKNTSFPLLPYYKAQILLNLQQDNLALDYINFFLNNKSNRKLYPKESRFLIDQKIFLESQKEIMDTIMASVYFISDKINHEAAEFSPVLTPKGLIFGSQNLKGIFYYDKNSKNKSDQPVQRKLYYAYGKGTELDSVEEFPIQIEKHEVSSITFDLDFKTAYLTGCQYNESLKKHVCKIFVSRMKDGTWSMPEKIKELDEKTEFSYTHVNLGYDPLKQSDILYFSSDREGGMGGYDIYYSYYDKRNKTFGRVITAGGKINTNRDELSPYFHRYTNTLYFSSNGKGGYGGLDIYSSKYENGYFLNTVHLGMEINSPLDDLFFSPDKNISTGYFVSNRYSPNSILSPHCCDDIYYFDKNIYENNKTKVRLKLVNNKKGLIDFFEYTISRIDSNKITPIEKGKAYDSTTIEDLVKNNSYQIELFSKSFYQKKITFSTNNDTSKVLTIEMDSIDYNPILLPLVEFEFDSFVLTPKAKLIIDSLVYPVLLNNPNLKIELSAHTDSRGDDEYNEILSEKRAKSIRDYLILYRNIIPERLVAKGYGEYAPIDNNENEDGSDNPVGRQRNRRCEFRILMDLYEDY
jgi:outer membrane protein OmpA-like peptidoglycan-associated protein